MPARSKRDAPFPRALARLNRRVANPVVRLLAGWLPPLAIVRHRGRVTGDAHATPVVAFGAGADLVIGVLYGTSSDWVSNVRAARRAQVTRHDRTREYGQPRLVVGQLWGGSEPSKPSGHVVAFPAPAPGAGRP